MIGDAVICEVEPVAGIWETSPVKLYFKNELILTEDVNKHTEQ